MEKNIESKFEKYELLLNSIKLGLKGTYLLCIQ